MVYGPGTRLVFGGVAAVANATLKLPKLTCALEKLYAPKNEKIANDDLDALAKCIFNEVIFVDMRILIPSVEG